MQPLYLPDGRLMCEICKSTYSSRGTWKIHCDTVHGPAEYFQCRLCNAVIKHKVYFRKHITLKHFKGGNGLVKNYAIRVRPS